ncbi:flavodoxin [Thermoleophilia bacterium SCSIO 60948]|nr:flavodoxin [Thermoleophilia bacterium SCSIO 60948]
MTVHVVTASRHGSTTEVGEAIARRLREAGLDARRVDAGSLDGLPPQSEPVVLGSPIYGGRWQRSARRILDLLAAEKHGARVVHIFSLGPLGEPRHPTDAQPEAEVTSYSAWHAHSAPVFAGRLERARLGPIERLMVRATGAPEGDFRDWPAIRRWADEIASGLRAGRDRGRDSIARAV